MATRLYVGGLNYNTTEDALKEEFAKAGEVKEANIIINKMTGHSKGFGFVEMANDADAAKAVEMFNGKEFDGRSLTVNEARPMKERSDFNGGGGGDRGGKSW
jgi:RNA recognition motif-containing protein